MARTPDRDRFQRFYTVEQNGCWRYTGRLTPKGYGCFYANDSVVNGGRSVNVRAHRFSYEMHVGPIPEGLVIDHLCRNRACVNPEHMEPVTVHENLMRGTTLAATNAAKTCCPVGHPYSGDNLYVVRYKNGRTARMCKTCQRERQRSRCQTKLVGDVG